MSTCLRASGQEWKIRGALACFVLMVWGAGLLLFGSVESRGYAAAMMVSIAVMVLLFYASVRCGVCGERIFLSMVLDGADFSDARKAVLPDVWRSG